MTTWDRLGLMKKQELFDQALSRATQFGVLLDNEFYLVDDRMRWADLTDNCRKLLLDVVGDAITDAAIRDDIEEADTLFELEVGMAFDMHKG